jgi:hypothetical protein
VCACAHLQCPHPAAKKRHHQRRQSNIDCVPTGPTEIAPHLHALQRALRGQTH